MIHDQEYDPMGVFSYKKPSKFENDKEDMFSKESGYVTNPDRIGQSEFEFQSSAAGERL